MGRLNRNNFLTFFKSGAGFDDIGTFVTNEQWGFVIWPLGADLSLWANIEGLAQTNYRTKVVGAHGGTVHHTFSNLDRYDYSVGASNYTMPFGTMTLPSDLPIGFVQLRLETAAGVEVGLSSPVFITDLAHAQKIGNRFRFRHRHSVNAVMYAHEEDFYQDFYLPVAEINGKVERENSTFKNWNTGKQTLLNTKTEYIKLLSVAAAGRLFHEAMYALSTHDTIYINEQPYCGRGVYNQNQPGIDGRSSGVMEVLDMANSTIHVL